MPYVQAGADTARPGSFAAVRSVIAIVLVTALGGLPLGALADYAVCGKTDAFSLTGTFDHCTVDNRYQNVCPAWWTPSSYAINFTDYPDTWGHSPEEACSLITAHRLQSIQVGTPQYLSPALGCTFQERNTEYGTIITRLSAVYRTCFPAGTPQPGPIVAPSSTPPLGCAAGAGGFMACPGNTPMTPNSANAPGTPPGGGLNPNSGTPGTDVSEPAVPPPPPPVDPERQAFQYSCRKADMAQDAASIGDPIFPGTGNNFYQEVDFRGADGFGLTRSYNSSLPGWTHNWKMSVIADSTTAVVLRPDGRAQRFTATGNGFWAGQTGTREQLVKLSTTDPAQPAWRFTGADDTQEYYDSQGVLMYLTLRGGRTYTLTRSNGRIVDVVDPFGRKIHFDYNPDGTINWIGSPEEYLFAYAYDTQGRLTSFTDPNNRVTQYLYENANYPLALTGVVDGRGVRIASWTYDNAGRATSYSSAGGADSYQVAYGSGGSVTVTDPLGTSRTQAYAQAGSKLLFSGQSQPCSNCTGDAASRGYDVAGLLAQSTDYLGISTMFVNDAQRKLPTTVTRAAGRPEQQQATIQWHPTFNVPTQVTESGRATSMAYDASGNLTSRTITDAGTGASRTWTWTYTAQGLPTSMTEPGGGQWQYEYNAGNLVKVTDPTGRVTQYDYWGGSSLPTTITEPSGNVVSPFYDPKGRIVFLNDFRGNTFYTYTAAGQLETVSMPNGYSYTYAYDNAQRLTSITDSRGPVVTYTYDNAGHRVVETLSNGASVTEVTRAYDSLGRVTGITGGQGTTTTLEYDANGVPVVLRKVNESAVTQLDPLGRPLSVTTADGTSVQRRWNALGQLTQVTDQKGVTTTFGVNAFGEVTTESTPDAGTRVYERDAAGRVTGTTDAVGNHVTFVRDLLGRPTQIAGPTQSQTFGYDAGGRLTHFEDKSGSTTLLLDPQGRVQTRTQVVNDNPSSPSQFEASYQYWSEDGDGLSDITYPSGLRVHYVRQLSHIVGVQVHTPAGRNWKPFVTGIAYTAWNAPSSWTWASGDTAARTFDREGKMTGNEFATYSYDAAGRMVGVNQKLWYGIAGADGTMQLATTPFLWTVGYDNRGRITRFDREGASSVFTYDANSNRLTSAESKTSDTDLDGDLDASDFSRTENRTSNLDGGSNRLLGFQFSVTKNAAGQTRSTATSTVTYSVDANGSLTSDGLRDFEYDEFNRMTKVRAMKDGESAIFSYLTNAQGQRVFKSEVTAEQTLPDANTLGEGFVAWLKSQFRWMFAQAQATTSIGTAYVYGDGEIPSWALLGEYDNGSATGKGRTEYIWLPTEDGGAIPIGMFRGGRFFAIHTDHLGTPRLMTNDANTPVWQWPYSAFGATKPSGVLAATDKPKAATTNQPVPLKATAPTELNLRYPGQYFDQELGTFYNMYRDSMDPAFGRYRQADPIGLAGGMNRFGYVNAKPTIASDPSGLVSGVVQVGGSYVKGVGLEGFVGAYLTLPIGNDHFDVGVYSSGGVGFGWNESFGASFGAMKGTVDDIRGIANNLNGTLAPAGGTVVFDKDWNPVGATFGYGEGAGASYTRAYTDAWSAREAGQSFRRWVRTKFGNTCPAR